MFYLVTGGFHLHFISYWPQIVVHRFVIFVLLQKHNPTLFFLFFFSFSSLCWVSSFHLKFFPGYLKQTLTTSDPGFLAPVQSWSIRVLHQQIALCNLFAETLLGLCYQGNAENFSTDVSFSAFYSLQTIKTYKFSSHGWERKLVTEEILWN